VSASHSYHCVCRTNIRRPINTRPVFLKFGIHLINYTKVFNFDIELKQKKWIILQEILVS